MTSSTAHPVRSAYGFPAGPSGRARRRPGVGLATLLTLLALLAAGDPALRAQPAEEEGPAEIRVPESDVGIDMLPVLEVAQQRNLEGLHAFAGFRFTDRLAESGITFRHRIVDDAGKAHKPVHYDHGNGIAVADVDGDGREDLYFLTQLGGNQLFRNRGDGTFEDVTGRAGVAVEEAISVTASFADVDNDGDPDLFVTTVRGGNRLFENDGTGRFEDVTEDAGVAYSGHSSGAVFFDYDRDGWLDLFVTNVGVYTSDEVGAGGYYVGFRDAFLGHVDPDREESSLLYRNLGDGRFEDVSEATGLVDVSWSGDAAFADLDGDLFPDLYVLNMQGDDHYYRNVGGERFEERTAEAFPKTPWGSMGVKFFDWDNDGALDLMLTDMHSDMFRDVTPGLEKLKAIGPFSPRFVQTPENNLFGNAFYQNRGDGTFQEVSDRIGTENYWPWGVSVGDLNADGWEDVLVTSSMNYPFRYGVNSVLLNDRGRRFTDSEFLLGVEPRRGELQVPWFELDCSGADREHKHCQGRSGLLTVYGAAGTRSAVIFDLEGDGDLDIVTNEFNGPPQVLVSDLSERRSLAFLRLRLRGTASNRDGLGARVTVHAGGTSVTRVHDGKSGYLSQSAAPLYIGLDGLRVVDSVEVVWPSGVVQTLDGGDVELNRTLEIVEPAAADRVAAAGGR